MIKDLNLKIYKIMRIFRISLILLLLSSYAFTAYSSNTSSYLISKAAIASFDYETVSEYYSNDNYDNLNIIDLNQSIVSFINSNKELSSFCPSKYKFPLKK